jgi:hypothetical protein
MTRKDYVMIARAVASARLPEWERATLINKLCAVFLEDNERFDAMRFAEACKKQDHK